MGGLWDGGDGSMVVRLTGRGCGCGCRLGSLRLFDVEWLVWSNGWLIGSRFDVVGSGRRNVWLV